MISKIKAIGLALVAVFAMSAVAASAAQAAVFHSNVMPTKLHGEQPESNKHTFTVGEGFGSITCQVAKFDGETEETTTNMVTITPTYETCSDSLGRTVHVTVEGTYTFTTEPVAVDLIGRITLKITNSSKEVKCTVTVLEQTGINGISYANAGTNHVDVTASSNNIKTKTEGGLLNCGVGNGEHTSGTYSGTVTVEGRDSEGNLGVLRYE